jgi:hypothetical protein
MNTQRVDYNFNASALGIGGYFVRGGKKVLVPSLASVALAPDGGEGWTSLTNYEEDGISFTRAESRVSGYETSRSFFTTRSDIHITNLSLFGKINVGQLQATVTSTRDLDDSDTDEAKFQLHASFFGVDVDGAGVVPRIDIDVCEATYKELLDRTIRSVEAESGVAAAESQVTALRRGEPIRSTMLHGIDHDDKPNMIKEAKNVLKVPGFAKIHFGELLVKRGRRRVNLLRIEFGNFWEDDHRKGLIASQHDSGSVTIASADGNGEPVWPRN